MISPDAIKAKALRLYPEVIKAWLAGKQDDYFPRRLPVNLRLPDDHAAAIDEVARLREGAKESLGYGYRIAWQSRRSRTHGLNQFPDSIWIDSLDDLVRLCDQQAEWRRLQVAVACLRRRQPRLEHWLQQGAHWKTLLQLAEELDDLLSLVDFLVTHPRPGIFAREIPIPVPTKLIERHRRQLAVWLDRLLPPDTIDCRYGYDAFEPRYGLRYARPHYLLRILDPQLQVELGLPFNELSLPAQALAKLPVRQAQVLLVENKTTLLSLPERARGIALGGLGNAITQLADIPWLKNQAVTYWGDLDAEGFEILDRLRVYLPAVSSLWMDEASVETYRHLATAGNSAIEKPLSHLTEPERRAYALLCEQGLRIEQEHLPTPRLSGPLHGSQIS